MRASLQGLFRSRRAGAFASLALALAAAACEGARPGANPDPSPLMASASPASAAASATAAASDAPAFPLSAAASAAASAAPEPSADGSAAGSAGSVASSASAARPPKLERLPTTKTGVLGPAQADKLLRAGAPPIVSLLSSGAAPRAVAAYGWKKGTKQTIELANTTTTTLTIGPKALPATTLPTLRFLVGLDAVDSLPAGDVKVRGEFAQISASGSTAETREIAKAIEPQLGVLKGMAVTYWTTRAGASRDVKLELPPKAPAQLSQLLGGLSNSFEQVAAPLPSEPIGAGARWSVLDRKLLNGLDLVQLAVYELTSRTGDTLELKVSYQQAAARSDLTLPFLPPNASAKLQSYKAEGKGSLSLDLAQLAAKSGTTTIDNAMMVEASENGTSTIVSASTSIELVITQKN